MVVLIAEDSNPVLDLTVKINEFILPDKRWSIPKLLQLGFPLILPLVLAVPIPFTDIPDKFCWGMTGSGDFSVKSATWKAHETLGPDPAPWKFRWI